MLSFRFIISFFLGAILLAWMIPAKWMEHEAVLTLAPQSPWSSVASIDDVSWGNGSPYARISITNSQTPLLLSQWSLENEQGERVEIGLGAETFTIGKTPQLQPILSATNTTLYVSFVASPLGVSFREHICSPYLRGTKPFVPTLLTQCPELTSHPGWNTLDSSCQLLVSSLPRCEALSPEHLADISPSCDAFLRSAPTFTSCMKESGIHGLLPSWRIFVAKDQFIKESGGTLILKDDRGMVVSTMQYQTIGIEE